jgi:hypothetical protein
MVWRIVLTALAAMILLVAMGLGGFVVYHDKTTKISHLQTQRQHLLATNGTLSSQLVITQAKLRTAARSFTLTKKNLTKMRKDLAAANERANANYSAGWDAGNTAGYGAGNSAGYSSGRSAGLVQASDQLSCSDDPDVTWLPYCN